MMESYDPYIDLAIKNGLLVEVTLAGLEKVLEIGVLHGNLFWCVAASPSNLLLGR